MLRQASKQPPNESDRKVIEARPPGPSHNRLVMDSNNTGPTNPLGAGEPTCLRVQHRPVLRRHVSQLFRGLR